MRVDFLTPRFLQRIKQLSPRHELLARAIGLKAKTTTWRVLDATAGLGQDGVLLALLGCEVTLIERSPTIAALLQEGLQRAQSDERFAHLAIQLLVSDAIPYLQALTPDVFPDVIYLDPMYPPRHKTALASKEMRYLRTVVGEDKDATELFTLALTRARYRVVVKRADHAQCITQRLPDWQLHGKTVRFDVYRPVIALNPLVSSLLQ
ncbi:MAG: class I SAM-dependent methyltransferase [Gammaproteobacteria bacterium]